MEYAEIFNYLFDFFLYIRSIDVTRILLLLFPHSTAVIVGCNALNSAATIYTTQKSKLYWLHSLVLVIIGGFGGGIIGPVLIGKPSIIMTNDMVIILCFISWYTILIYF